MTNWNTEFRIDAVPLDDVRRHYSDHAGWSCMPFNHDETGLPRAAIFRPRTGSGRQITVPIDRGRVIFAHSLVGNLFPVLDFPTAKEWAAPGARQIYCSGLDRWLRSYGNSEPKWGDKDDAAWLSIDLAITRIEQLTGMGYAVEERVVRPLWGLLAKLPEELVLADA